MNKHILFIVIGTKNYKKLARDCINSIASNWYGDSDISFLILTDQVNPLYDELLKVPLPTKHSIEYQTNENPVPLENKTAKIYTKYIPHLPWPLITLLRYKFFVEYSYLLENYDYIIYIDADMRVIEPINDSILGERIVVRHPGFYKQSGGPYETNPLSTAEVRSLFRLATDNNVVDSKDPKLNINEWRYYQGCLQGGSKQEFMKMSRVLHERINQDLSKNIIACWHDESHMNKYMIENPPDKVLSPSYAYPEKWNLPFEKIIIGIDKDNNQIRQES